MLGTEEDAQGYFQQKLADARTAWQARRYDEKLIPSLQRDPFESWQEFGERLAARPWYVGQARLQKCGYKIKTRQFPLRLEELRDWARSWSWLLQQHDLHVCLARDAAQTLYQQSPTWPAYLWLTVKGDQPQWRDLVLVGPEGELPIETASAKSATIPGPVSKPGRIGYENRYIDPGDGTVIDSKTNLQWMRCIFGQEWQNGGCVGRMRYFEIEYESYPSTVKSAIEEFNATGGYAGYQDWCLPTYPQLRSIICCTRPKPWFWQRKVYWGTKSRCDLDSDSPAIDTAAFDYPIRDKCCAFLTSSSKFFTHGYGFFSGCWMVNFDSGTSVHLEKEAAHGYIRLVRKSKHDRK